MDTLAVRLTLPLAGCVEDLHLLVSAPCRAHQRKTPKISLRRQDKGHGGTAACGWRMVGSSQPLETDR